LIITSDIKQNKIVKDIIFEWKAIWYTKLGVKVLFMPSFELFTNYFVPKIWQKQFWVILKYAKNFSSDIVQIHMRFFFFSLLGFVFAKTQWLPIVLWEHSSNFIIFSSTLKNIFARLYDNLIWRLLYKFSNALIVLNQDGKFFVSRFTSKPIYVINRGFDIPQKTQKDINYLKKKFPNKIIIWSVGRLVYWKHFHYLIKSFYKLPYELRKSIQFVIVWWWEEFDYLKRLDKENLVYFTGEVSFQEAIDYQSEFDIYVHSSSQGGALAGTLLQAMALGNLIVATPYEWANEVIKNMGNWILLKDDSVDELVHWIKTAYDVLEKKEIWANENLIIIHKRFDRKDKLEEFYSVYKKVCLSV